MNKKFTKLIAVLALLVFMTPSLAGWGQSVDSYSATDADKPSAVNGTTTGTVTGTNSISWSYSVTQQTKTNYNPYVAYNSSYGWQLGSSNSPCKAFSISTSGITGIITKVEVVSGSYNSSSTICVTVGGADFGTQNQATGSGSSVTTQTFNGSASGEIIVSASASSRAFYFKSVTVTYTSGYTVTYNCNGATSGCPDPNVITGVPAGSYTLASAPDKTDYTFNGWNDGTTTYNAGASYTISGNVTFTAQWTPDFDYISVTPSSFDVPVAGDVIEMEMETNLTSPSYSVVYYTSSACDETTTQPSWFDDVEFSGNTLDIAVVANDGVARHAYFKVKSGNIYSDVVTVNQEAITVNPVTFNPVDGTIMANGDLVELTTTTSGANIYYTMGNNPADPTSESTLYNATDKITLTESTTIKAIAIKNGVSSTVSTASYTVVNPLTTIEQVFSAATGTATSVYVTFGNWVVSGVGGNNNANVYVTDNAGHGFIIYKNGGNLGFSTGDVLSGTVQATLQLYNGAAEFTNLTSSTSGLTVTKNGTVTPITDKTIAELSGVNTGAVYTLSNLTYDENNTTYQTQVFIDGTNTIEPYTHLMTWSSISALLTDGLKYNVTGVYQQNTNNNSDVPQRIHPRSADDIVAVPYTLTIDGNGGLVAVYVDNEEVQGTNNQYSIGNGKTVTLEVAEPDGKIHTGWTSSPTITIENNSFTMPSQNVTITAQYADCYTLTFTVNGDSQNATNVRVQQGNSFSAWPAITNVPEGFTAVGWMEHPEHPYYNATEAPAMVSGTITPNSNKSFDAVLAVGVTAPSTWVLSSEAPAAGDQVILAAADDGGTYYAMYNKGNNKQLTVNGITITTESPENYSWNVVSATYGNYSGLGLLYQNSDQSIFHMNNSSFNVTTTYNNGVFEFTTSGSGYTMKSLVNTRYLKFTSTNHSYSVSQNSTDACTLYVFKYTVGSTTMSDYTTLVTNHANQTFIAEDDDETLYGIHFIDGEVMAIYDVANEGKIVVTEGGYLDMDEAELINIDENNLIIEDGAQLYTEDVVEATIKKNITAYDPTLIGQGVSNGWYFISYPLNTNGTNGDDPTSVTNMIASTPANYDLYELNGNTWENYKNQNHTENFFLQNGHGYLYANANGINLEFAGSLNYRDPENDFVSLDNTGWNLVGNPFAYNTYPSMSYYKMNEAGTGIDATEYTTADAVPPCTGILVYDDEDDPQGLITFSKTAPASGGAKGGINLTLAETQRGAAKLDNAIVSFNEGSKLGKFYFMQQNANLYIPQGTEEYAIVSTEAQGTMPVNFRANANGQYTLTVNPENVEMNYLHLIDNMTGADIDLLQTPSYTFNANVTDYESRFKLVFATNNEDGASTGSATFAFYSNGNWIINNAGEATLQVVDITGRILSSETVNGSVSKTINATSGVYMLRLINGENVKVQKIVVR